MGELTICADNGIFQKNHIIIWFIIWLIETGNFPKATIIFYVRVHTNNAADCLFNVLKGGH